MAFLPDSSRRANIIRLIITPSCRTGRIRRLWVCPSRPAAYSLFVLGLRFLQKLAHSERALMTGMTKICIARRLMIDFNEVRFNDIRDLSIIKHLSFIRSIFGVYVCCCLQRLLSSGPVRITCHSLQPTTHGNSLSFLSKTSSQSKFVPFTCSETEGIRRQDTVLHNFGEVFCGRPVIVHVSNKMCESEREEYFPHLRRLKCDFNQSEKFHFRLIHCCDLYHHIMNMYYMLLQNHLPNRISEYVQCDHY